MASRLQRIAIAAIIFGLLAYWVHHWAERFFAARRVAEDRMLELQELMARGYFSPALQGQVDAALSQSHQALALALGGPLLLMMGFFAAVWLLSGRSGAG